MGMAKKYGAEQIVNLLRQIEVAIANGKTHPVACQEVGIHEVWLLTVSVAQSVVRSVYTSVCEKSEIFFCVVRGRSGRCRSAARARPSWTD
jgi:hypothetical protein